MVLEKLGDFLNSSKRVLTVSKKPGWDEFKVMAQVTALGIVIIAIIGFMVTLFFSFFNIS